MDGFLNVAKPGGVTSHDVVAAVRGTIGERRVGHLGTLDPLAVGVLPLACGAYSRLSEYFLVEDKRYLAEFTFGVRTSSGDLGGEILEERDASRAGPREVENFLAGLTGRIAQTPPAYSALKVKGKKLVDLARRGIRVVPEPREVTVYEFRLVGWVPGSRPRGVFSLRVGRGTYVRSLATSLGELLGCGAAVSYLLRSRTGWFTLAESVSLPALARLASEGRTEEAFSDPARALYGYPAFTVSGRAVEKVAHGAALGPGDLEPRESGARRPSLREGPFPYKAVLFVPGAERKGGPRLPPGRRPGMEREAPLRDEVAAVVTVIGPDAVAYDKVLIAE